MVKLGHSKTAKILQIVDAFEVLIAMFFGTQI